jgi:hypothetical protein
MPQLMTRCKNRNQRDQANSQNKIRRDLIVTLEEQLLLTCIVATHNIKREIAIDSFNSAALLGYPGSTHVTRYHEGFGTHSAT